MHRWSLDFNDLYCMMREGGRERESEFLISRELICNHPRDFLTEVYKTRVTIGFLAY